VSRAVPVRVPGERTPYLREDLEDMLYYAATLLDTLDPHGRDSISEERIDLIEFCKLYEEALDRR